MQISDQCDPQGKAARLHAGIRPRGMYVNLLFELEDKIRRKHAGDYEARRQARLEKETPDVNGFLVWLKQQTPPRCDRMAKAVTFQSILRTRS